MDNLTKNQADENAHELYGRLMECCDISLAIESGQFKSLDDVLAAVTARASSINQQLIDEGEINQGRHTSDNSTGEAMPAKLNS